MSQTQSFAREESFIIRWGGGGRVGNFECGVCGGPGSEINNRWSSGEGVSYFLGHMGSAISFNNKKMSRLLGALPTRSPCSYTFQFLSFHSFRLTKSIIFVSFLRSKVKPKHSLVISIYSVCL